MLFALALLMVLNVALIGLQIASIPVRGLFAIGFLIIFSLLYPEETRRGLERHKAVFLLAMALALLGAFVSLVNGTDLSMIFRAILEVHVQIVVTLAAATIAAEVAGAMASALTIVGAIALSTLVAVPQFAGSDLAWRIHEVLAKCQGHPVVEDWDVLNRHLQSTHRLALGSNLPGLRA